MLPDPPDGPLPIKDSSPGTEPFAGSDFLTNSELLQVADLQRRIDKLEREIAQVRSTLKVVLTRGRVRQLRWNRRQA